MKMYLLLLLPAAFILAGCSNIRSRQPVGELPLDLSASIGDQELGSIAGDWVNADGKIATVTVEDAENGVVLYESRDEEEAKPMKFQLRVTGDDIFVNFEPNKQGERAWLLMGVGGNFDEILVWEPDRELFRKLIAEGMVKGVNDPETVVDEEGEEVKAPNPGAVIDDPSGEWVRKMVEGEFGVVVDWRHPKVLRKVASEAGE